MTQNFTIEWTKGAYQMARGGPYTGRPLGNTEMEQAINALNKKQQTAMNLLTHYKAPRKATVAMLFDPTTIEKATAARGIVEPDYGIKTYELNGIIQRLCSLRIDYEGLDCLPIKASRMERQPSIQPLIDHLDEMMKVYDAYEQVKATLRWMNLNCTTSSIRYYWPSIMQLAPRHSVFSGMEQPPKRFDTNPWMYKWMQVLRDTGNTVTAMALMPEDARPKEASRMMVSIHKRKVVINSNDGIDYHTDSMSFFI